MLFNLVNDFMQRNNAVQNKPTFNKPYLKTTNTFVMQEAKRLFRTLLKNL